MLTRSVIAWGAMVAMLAGAAGWSLAGSGGQASVAPPPCPSSFAAGFAVAGPAPGGGSVRPGRGPVPVGPLPIGPVTVRICRYGALASAPIGSSSLDAARTAELAGRLDTADSPASSVPGTVDHCGVGDGPVLLVFRYSGGKPPLVLACPRG